MAVNEINVNKRKYDSDDDDDDDVSSPEAVFQDLQNLSAANAKFALDLYKFHTSATDQNIFMSPLSISVALALTYLGARGQTKSQMGCAAFRRCGRRSPTSGVQ